MTDMETLSQHFKCSITGHYFVNPVVTADGHTYERAAIERWFLRKRTSPISNATLLSKRVVPSLTVRQSVGILMDGDHVDKTSKGIWHVETGILKYRGILPGGSDAAKCHFLQAIHFENRKGAIFLDALKLQERANNMDIDIIDFLRPVAPSSTSLDAVLEAVHDDVMWEPPPGLHIRGRHIRFHDSAAAGLEQAARSPPPSP